MHNSKIFREYDIRGEFGSDFDVDLASSLGRLYGQLLELAPAEGRKRPLIGVGFDCRLSSPELRDALTEGLQQAGLDVLDCGMGPTPQLYFSVVKKNLDGGIQISASHNPGPDNGFKMMAGQRTLSGPDIEKLKNLIEAKDFTPVQEKGDLQIYDAAAEYLEELVKISNERVSRKRKLKVVVDGGNGMGGELGSKLLRELGCEVIELYTEPDGRFPNHHPDPTVLENIVELRELVKSSGADVGIAWDGDADRIGVVDELGNPIYGDMLVLIYGRALLEEVSSPTIIGDVKCSKLLFEDLNAKGANAIMSKTGHSLIKAKLKELDAELAGEMSGHIFFSHRYFGYDDGIHAAGRLIEILSNTDKKASELLADLPVMVNTPEIRVDCLEEIKFEIAERAKTCFDEFETSMIDGVRISFDKGWGLVRASNTQPALVMRFEAEDSESLESYRALVEQRISKVQEQIIEERSAKSNSAVV